MPQEKCQQISLMCLRKVQALKGGRSWQKGAGFTASLEVA